MHKYSVQKKIKFYQINKDGWKCITDFKNDHTANSNEVLKSSCHIELKLFSYYFLLRWAAVRIRKGSTCQFTFIYICECGFAFRFNLFGAGRWQASRLTYNNPSSSCSAQSQSTGTHKLEVSLHVHHRKHWNLADLGVSMTLYDFENAALIMLMVTRFVANILLFLHNEIIKYDNFDK